MADSLPTPRKKWWLGRTTSPISARTAPKPTKSTPTKSTPTKSWSTARSTPRSPPAHNDTPWQRTAVQAAMQQWEKRQTRDMTPPRTVTVRPHKATPLGFRLKSTEAIGTKGYIHSVEAVGDGTPAERSGLKVGELVLKLNGKSITNLNHTQLSHRIADERRKKKLSLTTTNIVREPLPPRMMSPLSKSISTPSKSFKGSKFQPTQAGFGMTTLQQPEARSSIDLNSDENQAQFSRLSSPLESPLVRSPTAWETNEPIRKTSTSWDPPPHLLLKEPSSPAPRCQARNSKGVLEDAEVIEYAPSGSMVKVRFIATNAVCVLPRSHMSIRLDMSSHDQDVDVDEHTDHKQDHVFDEYTPMAIEDDIMEGLNQDHFDAGDQDSISERDANTIDAHTHLAHDSDYGNPEDGIDFDSVILSPTKPFDVRLVKLVKTATKKKLGLAVKEKNNMIVISKAQGSAAAAGLLVGMEIKGVNGVYLDTTQQSRDTFQDIMQNSATVELIMRADEFTHTHHTPPSSTNTITTLQTIKSPSMLQVTTRKQKHTRINTSQKVSPFSSPRTSPRASPYSSPKEIRKKKSSQVSHTRLCPHSSDDEDANNTSTINATNTTNDYTDTTDTEDANNTNTINATNTTSDCTDTTDTRDTNQSTTTTNPSSTTNPSAHVNSNTTTNPNTTNPNTTTNPNATTNSLNTTTTTTYNINTNSSNANDKANSAINMSLRTIELVKSGKTKLGLAVKEQNGLIFVSKALGVAAAAGLQVGMEVKGINGIMSHDDARKPFKATFLDLMKSSETIYVIVENNEEGLSDINTSSQHINTSTQNNNTSSHHINTSAQHALQSRHFVAVTPMIDVVDEATILTPEENAMERLGYARVQLSFSSSKKLGLKVKVVNGAFVVSSIAPHGVAAESGKLQRGMRVSMVNGVEIPPYTSEAMFQTLIRTTKNDFVELVVEDEEADVLDPTLRMSSNHSDTSRQSFSLDVHQHSQPRMSKHTNKFRTTNQKIPSNNNGSKRSIAQAMTTFNDADDLASLLLAFDECCTLAEIDISTTRSLSLYEALRVQVLPQLDFKSSKVFRDIERKIKTIKSDSFQAEALVGIKCVVVGAGPIGLRAAIEFALQGADVTVIEMRTNYTRLNILHLWDWLCHDLTSLGCSNKELLGKSFYHIGTRRLQLILTRIACILGVRIFSGVTFKRVISPSEHDVGGNVNVNGFDVSSEHNHDNDVVADVDANDNGRCRARDRGDGRLYQIAITKSNDGFNARCGDHLFANLLLEAGGASGPVRQSLGMDVIPTKMSTALGLVSHFHRTGTKDAMDEFSYASQFKQKQFKKLKHDGYDIENCVYYQGDTHYFVMTPTVQSLVKSGAVRKQRADPRETVERNNIDYVKLKRYARHIAEFFGLPRTTQFVQGSQSCQLFDFSTRSLATKSSTVLRDGDTSLFVSILGDALIEPFWPEGLGVNRGFLSIFDTAFVVQKYFSNGVLSINHEERMLAARHELFELQRGLNGNTSKTVIRDDFRNYTINPTTRYKNYKATRHSSVEVSMRMGSNGSNGPAMSTPIFEPFGVTEEDEDATIVQTIPSTSTTTTSDMLTLDTDEITAGETRHSVLSSMITPDSDGVGYASAMDLYEMDKADEDSNADEEKIEDDNDNNNNNNNTNNYNNSNNNNNNNKYNINNNINNNNNTNDDDDLGDMCETVSKVNNYASAMDLYNMDNEDNDDNDANDGDVNDDADDVNDGGDRKTAGGNITQPKTHVNHVPLTTISNLPPSTTSKPLSTTFPLPPTTTTPSSSSSSSLSSSSSSKPTTTPTTTTMAITPTTTPTPHKAKVVEEPVKESRSWRRNSKGRRNSKDEQPKPKLQIGSPIDFVHVAHVGMNSSTPVTNHSLLDVASRREPESLLSRVATLKLKAGLKDHTKPIATTRPPTTTPTARLTAPTTTTTITSPTTASVTSPTHRRQPKAKPVKKSGFTAMATPKCPICTKSVYAMEKLEADGKVYHKKCFRCNQCNKAVSTGSFASLNGKIFCKPHFKQLFKLKGNYDEGFGGKQHKHKWDKNVDITSHTDA